MSFKDKYYLVGGSPDEYGFIYADDFYHTVHHPTGIDLNDGESLYELREIQRGPLEVEVNE